MAQLAARISWTQNLQATLKAKKKDKAEGQAAGLGKVVARLDASLNELIEIARNPSDPLQQQKVRTRSILNALYYYRLTEQCLPEQPHSWSRPIAEGKWIANPNPAQLGCKLLSYSS